MKSIRSKLFLYFFVFVLLFNFVAISIYISSSKLMNEYHSSFQHFLVLNTVSQISNKLYESTKTYVMEQDDDSLNRYYQIRAQLKEQQKLIHQSTEGEEIIQLKNYTNLIEALIYQTELTVGFVLKDNMERYTAHLKEAESTASYIQDTTLQLIDIELTDYQSFYKDLQKRNEAFRLFILFLFLTTVLLAVFIAIRFAYGINKPVQILSRAAKEVSTGKFDGEPVTIKSNDELKLLGDSFNTMRSNIRDLIVEMKDKSEQERLMKELELKHLQNQINPHFLFNTLNTVSKMAYLEDARSTSNLIDSVAALLRHSLGDIQKKVQLKDEIAIVRDYLSIQKTRFMERIDFTVDIDDSCLEVYIPRLTLQPIIENAFIHGVEPKEEGGLIALYVYREYNHIVVEVKDNGVGMTEQQLERILSFRVMDEDEEHVGHSTGLGLENVIRRLQLFYRTEHVIEIESRLNEGTSFRLLIPKNFNEVVEQEKEGDGHASDHSRG